MEKSKSFAKKLMSSVDKDSEIESEEIIDSKIFRPKDIVKSIQVESIKKMADFIKSQDVLNNIMHSLYHKEDKSKTIKISNELFQQIIHYNKEVENIRTSMYLNQDKYRRKSSKIDTGLLCEVTEIIDKKDRNINLIKEKYNSETKNLKVSDSTIRRNLVNNLNYRYKSPELKDERFFQRFVIQKQIVFIFRLIKDLHENNELVFFDECGINSKPNRRMIWVRGNEDNKIKKKSYYKSIIY